MQGSTITISADVGPFLEQIDSLSKLPSELIKRFIGAVEAGSQVARIDVDRLSTTGAGNVRIILKPSDFLVEFMAAAGAGESDRMIREKV